jgi:dethiobiotin synthetase
MNELASVIHTQEGTINHLKEEIEAITQREKKCCSEL